MGKLLPVLCSLALLGGFVLVPRMAAPVRAQTSTPPSCSASAVSSPMQGHYTGPWHSDGDYHFAVFNTDLDLKIIIDGTLDVTVNGDGTISGTAHGTVDAPIYHDGIHDVSSGTGTISGILSGAFSGPSSQLVLSHPVIDMQWGTFIAGGYTVPRSITMPDYQLPAAGVSCTSSQGTIAETNFPTQFIVADGASGLTQAPGIGSATGTWSLTSDGAAAFAGLSQQVDAFISSAGSALNGSQPLSLAGYEAAVGAPLRTLLTAIQQHPDVSRCLLARLDSWMASTLPALYARAGSASTSSDLPALRADGDLLRFLRLMQSDCTVSDGGVLNALTGTESAALDHAVAGRDWAGAALLARELVLLAGGPGGLPPRLAADLHTLLGTGLDPAGRLDAARIAYAVGDDADAAVVLSASASHTEANLRQLTAHKSKPSRKRRKPAIKATPRPTSTPRPTAAPTRTPTPTPTATPRPSLAMVLGAGATPIAAHSTGGATPTFSWAPVTGVARYVVFVTAGSPPQMLWSWSGTGTSVQYGDTALAGTSGWGDDAWPVGVSSGSTWSVLALDGSGRIIGLALRLQT